ncbi:hypothetical protein Bbelb_132030 [Branchiostoma belcheri]|nr:hypothetical protein Bbelb_132030 [Branchiostoma belcheri]
MGGRVRGSGKNSPVFANTSLYVYGVWNEVVKGRPRLSALQYVSSLWFDNKSWVFGGLRAQSEDSLRQRQLERRLQRRLSQPIVSRACVTAMPVSCVCSC